MSLNDIFIYTLLRQINLSVIENRVITLASVATGNNDLRNNGRNELEGVHKTWARPWPRPSPTVWPTLSPTPNFVILTLPCTGIKRFKFEQYCHFCFYQTRPQGVLGLKFN